MYWCWYKFYAAHKITGSIFFFYDAVPYLYVYVHQGCRPYVCIHQGSSFFSSAYHITNVVATSTLLPRKQPALMPQTSPQIMHVCIVCRWWENNHKRGVREVNDEPPHSVNKICHWTSCLYTSFSFFPRVNVCQRRELHAIHIHTWPKKFVQQRPEQRCAWHNLVFAACTHNKKVKHLQMFCPHLQVTFTSILTTLLCRNVKSHSPHARRTTPYHTMEFKLAI